MGQIHKLTKNRIISLHFVSISSVLRLVRLLLNSAHRHVSHSRDVCLAYVSPLWWIILIITGSGINWETHIWMGL